MNRRGFLRGALLAPAAVALPFMPPAAKAAAAGVHTFTLATASAAIGAYVTCIKTSNTAWTLVGDTKSIL